MFEILTKHRPTLFYGIPTLYASMLATKDAEKRYDLSSLRLCMSAGEALPEELYTRWRERFGVELIDCIGTTEILHCFLSNVPGQVRAGYVGTPQPGVECRIAENGEVLVKSPGQMMGYYKMPEKTADDMTPDGFFRTGDRGELDALGRLRITGRVKELFKTSKGK